MRVPKASARGWPSTGSPSLILPTRSVFEVAGLANPSWLVEIEVVAVRP